MVCPCDDPEIKRLIGPGACYLCNDSAQLKLRLLRLAPGSKAKAAHGGIKLTAEDTRWAKQIKERDNYRCRRCDRAAPDWKVEAAHIFSRRHKTTRTNLDNGLTLCVTCHRWGHENAGEWKSYVVSEIGQIAYHDLEQLTASKKILKRKESL